MDSNNQFKNGLKHRIAMAKALAAAFFHGPMGRGFAGGVGYTLDNSPVFPLRPPGPSRNRRSGAAAARRVALKTRHVRARSSKRSSPAVHARRQAVKRTRS